MIQRRYSIILRPDAEHGGYWVEVPALPGCYTQGDTAKEAVRNAEDVIALYVEDLLSSGEPVPEEPIPCEVRQVEVAA